MNKQQIEEKAKALLPKVLKAIAKEQPIVAANALYMAMQIVDCAEVGKSFASKEEN